MRAFSPTDWLGQITFAVRRLRRAPVFVLATITLLGVGMGIAAATVSLLNLALFKDRARDMGLVHIAIHAYQTSLPEEVTNRVLNDAPTSFESLAGFGLLQGAAVIDDASRRVAIEAVTGSYFSILGAVPDMGRTIQPADAERSALVSVISATLWKSAFGQRPDILGRALVVAGKRLEIVGVMGQSPRPGARGADVWVPAHLMPVDTLFGRLRPDVTLAHASAEIAGRYGAFDLPQGRLTPLVRPGLSAPYPRDSYVNFAWAAGLALMVSLIASVSFGLLLFARMAATQSDLAVRIALGATARDLTRLLALEVLVLALAATVVAVNVGTLLARFVVAQVLESAGWPVVVDLSTDWRVFLAVGGLTLAVALLVVARLGWRATQVEALGSMVATGGIGGATIRAAGTSTRLLVAQSAASAALLLLAALVMRQALHTNVHGAFDVSGTAIARIDPSGLSSTPAGGTTRARSVLRAAEQLPGLKNAAITSSLPGSATLGMAILNGGSTRNVSLHYASAGLFDAFGITVVKGRTFTAEEDIRVMPVAVISEAAAQSFWPGVNPIGRQMSVVRGYQNTLDVVVVGVVSDVESWSTRRPVPIVAAYLPVSHRLANTALTLVGRSDRDASQLADQFRTSLQKAAPDTAFISIRTLQEEVEERLAPPPAVPRVFGVLGLIVLLVAVGGLYGLMSYLAAMRRREIAIRKALGATRTALCRMLVRERSSMLSTGVALGIITGLLIANLFKPTGSEFRLLDPVAIFGVATFLFVAGLAGSIAPFIPALREQAGRLRD